MESTSPDSLARKLLAACLEGAEPDAAAVNALAGWALDADDAVGSEHALRDVGDDEGDIGTAGCCRAGERNTLLAAGAIGEETHRIDRLKRRPCSDERALALERPIAEQRQSGIRQPPQESIPLQEMTNTL